MELDDYDFVFKVNSEYKSGKQMSMDEWLRRRAIEGVPDSGDQDAPSLVDVPVPTPVFKPFQELADGWTGHMIVLYQEPKEGRDHLSRSCAMRVEGVPEMIRVLEVFFKL